MSLFLDLYPMLCLYQITFFLSVTLFRSSERFQQKSPWRKIDRAVLTYFFCNDVLITDNLCADHLCFENFCFKRHGAHIVHFWASFETSNGRFSRELARVEPHFSYFLYFFNHAFNFDGWFGFKAFH